MRAGTEQHGIHFIKHTTIMAISATKPWYKSKIVLIALAATALFLGTYLKSQGITQTQLDVLEQSYPDIAAAVEQYQTDNNFFALIGTLASTTIAIIRVWFTQKIIQQSI